MMLESMFGLSLVLNVSLSTEVPAATDPVPWLLSAPQKQAELLPLVRRATECIVHKVTDDPRYRADMRLDEVNDLIVDLLPACGPVVRAMMDTHDRMYGTGSGRAFLLGPYLDVLPSAVVRQVRAKVPQQ